jgi:hypothetical protein
VPRSSCAFSSLTLISKSSAFRTSCALKWGASLHQRWVRDAVDAAAPSRAFARRTDGAGAYSEALPLWNPTADPFPHPPRKGEGKAGIPIFGKLLDPDPNHLYHARIPSHQEGRLAIVTKRGAGCGGRGSADNERHCCVRRSRVVLTPGMLASSP